MFRALAYKPNSNIGYQLLCGSTGIDKPLENAGTEMLQQICREIHGGVAVEIGRVFDDRRERLDGIASEAQTAIINGMHLFLATVADLHPPPPS
jgi:hypothetical protein